jgi:hypothetical protein
MKFHPQFLAAAFISMLLCQADGALAYGGGTGSEYYGEGTYGCGVTAPSPDALLWSSRGGNPVYDFCCGKSDSTPLPQDPRSLVQPGISDGRNVVFNVAWRDCHVYPELVGEYPNPRTCGELRTRVQAGHNLMVPGSPGAGSLFSGTDPYSIESLLGTGVMTSTTYNSLWLSWGFTSRPPNYDFLLSQRYGTGLGAKRNPYPLPGENPNWTNGGSGQLPVMFTQIRKADGTWTGDIGITCQGCHNGEIGKASQGQGLGVQIGGGSNNVDWDLFLHDMLPFTADYLASIATLANLNRVRGTNNASDVNIAFLFPDEEPYDFKTLLGLLTSGSTAGMDTPAWWNMGHRPVKFVDGVFPMDAPRVDMVFYTPFLGLFGSLGGPLAESAQDWMRKNGQNGNEWVQILKSPPYPETIDAIDTTLAKQGAVLFHELDLWGAGRNNRVPAPTEKGNGSCASCHGAYAPRYFNDPAYLASPVLEGQAGNVAAMNVIGTDPARYDTNNEAMIKAGDVNFFGYPPLVGTENDCSPLKFGGYVAPPLYGVWANSPYLHNGSIPNLWQVLKSSDRPAIWERVSTPKPSGWEGLWYWSSSAKSKLVMGYDTDLNRAFDFDKVGWKYVNRGCENIKKTCNWLGICTTYTPPLYLQCGITGAVNNDPLFQSIVDYAQSSSWGQIMDFLNSNVILFWNLFQAPDITVGQMEERKIYNTNHYAQGNEGHQFTDVLTDAERKALIEYMETL